MHNHSSEKMYVFLGFALKNKEIRIFEGKKINCKQSQPEKPFF